MLVYNFQYVINLLGFKNKYENMYGNEMWISVIKINEQFLHFFLFYFFELNRRFFGIIFVYNRVGTKVPLIIFFPSYIAIIKKARSSHFYFKSDKDDDKHSSHTLKFFSFLFSSHKAPSALNIITNFHLNNKKNYTKNNR